MQIHTRKFYVFDHKKSLLIAPYALQLKNNTHLKKKIALK